VAIYNAVEEGRVVFDNVRKVTYFLVSTGVAAIASILYSLAAGIPLPFLPAQLLWLNVVTNGLQDVALAFEPGEKGVLDRPPRRRAGPGGGGGGGGRRGPAPPRGGGAAARRGGAAGGGGPPRRWCAPSGTTSRR
jgi:hypothetical protein